MKKELFTLIVSILCLSCQCQETDKKHRIMFYNVENLFHPSDDSLTADEDFTPTGAYHWTYRKYYRKVSMIGKVIIALGEGEPPCIVGLAEIENERVLKDLCYNSPLRKFGYRYIHYDSPDRRGVDVALLYRPEFAKAAKHRKIPVIFPFDSSSRNRDILHATFRLGSGDSVEVFLNHWTSRYGGYAATVPKRNHYARVLREVCDSILAYNSDAKIIIMGDFNDYADNESLSEILCERKKGGTNFGKLINLSSGTAGKEVSGTHKHEDFWGCLDQVIVSKGLMEAKGGARLMGGFRIFDAGFLLVDDEKYGGKKNHRTFSGPRYIGGFSDHLPIYISFADN